MDISVLQAINKARADRQAIAVVTDTTTGEQQVVYPASAADHVLGAELNARFLSGKSGMIDQDGKEQFIAVHVPAPRLVVVGAVHISQALYPMALNCGFDVTIIDPRTAFATAERFSGVALHAEWPQDVLAKIPFDAYTAVAAVTHDPKIDDLPLRLALEAGCFYVGALGSRKTHAKRQERLLAAGVASKDIARICAPIGLDIGAASPAEIAVSILAQIIAAMRKSEAK